MATSIIFWSKIRSFLIYVFKDPPCSCDHFHVKIMVVGGCCVGENNEIETDMSETRGVPLRLI